MLNFTVLRRYRVIIAMGGGQSMTDGTFYIRDGIFQTFF